VGSETPQFVAISVSHRGNNRAPSGVARYGRSYTSLLRKSAAEMTIQVSQPVMAQKHIGDHPIVLLCWKCKTPLGPITMGSSPKPTARSCSSCSSTTASSNGVWLTMSPQRDKYFERFISEYEFIRSAEGRGSRDSRYLPRTSLSRSVRRNTGQWKIRSRTFRYIAEHILAPLADLAK